jgi:3-oxoacyl-[acyl-carrier-protein] synthase II
MIEQIAAERSPVAVPQIATRPRPPVISAWSVVSPLGIGREDFARGLAAGTPAAAPLGPEHAGAPVDRACVVPGFSAVELLGKKGTRSMDRATALAVVAVGRLLESAEVEDADAAALVLGTSSGSVRSIMSFTRDSLTQQRPYFVDPARFPNTVMNCAAGQCAIWYTLRGPNATIAGGRTSGLLALNYALRLQRSGHARTVLCGAVEEFSAERAWLEWHARPDGDGEPLLGEGCAVMLVEPGAPDGAGPGSVEVLALEFGVAEPGGEVFAVLSRCIRRALVRAGVDERDVSAVAPSLTSGRAAAGEQAAILATLGEEPRTVVRSLEVLGDTHAASASFQIASVLAAGERDPEAVGPIALVTSADRHGTVGCALLRLGTA